MSDIESEHIAPAHQTAARSHGFVFRLLESVVGAQAEPEPGQREAHAEASLQLLDRLVTHAERRKPHVREDVRHRAAAEPERLLVPADLRSLPIFMLPARAPLTIPF